MNQKNFHATVLTLTTSQAAHLADELVGEPIGLLELRMEPDGVKGKQAQPAYTLQRNQALTRGKGGYKSANNRSKVEAKDRHLGHGETSAELLARRLE
jgi:hypothetical protein